MKSIIKLKDGTTDVLWYDEESKETYASRLGRALVDYIPDQDKITDGDKIIIKFTKETK